jgi:hypothetical protein
MTDILHTIERKEDLRYKFSQCGKIGFCVLNTDERGRLLCFHTDKSGRTGMNPTKIKVLFNMHKCRGSITCFPAQLYREEPELAKYVNVLYPECFQSVFSDIQKEGIIMNKGELQYLCGKDLFPHYGEKKAPVRRL